MILKVLPLASESLSDLLSLFFETRQEMTMAHVAFVFKQESSNAAAIFPGSWTQVCES